MTGKFDKIGGQLLVEYNGRTVIQTSGTLLQFLTGSTTYTRNLVWPDALKGEIYQWSWNITRISNNRGVTRFARSSVGARPQEWTSTIVLGAAPTGADLFIGRATLNRTVDPSHTWSTQTISPMIPQGVPIQINGGSMIIEAAAGITRSLTIDVVSGDLVAILEQSVGPEAGNFRRQGTYPPADPASGTAPNNVTFGNENTAPSGEGFPVYWNDVAPYYLNDFLSTTNNTAAVLFAWDAQNGRADQVTYSDPTDYGSTYSLSLSGRFGRRS